MTTIPLRASADLIAQILRLDPLGAEITGARFDANAGHIVFDVSVPDAPAGATGMEPAYQREYPSERYLMIDPGYVVPEAETPRTGGCICKHPDGWSNPVGHSALCQIQQGYPIQEGIREHQPA